MSIIDNVLAASDVPLVSMSGERCQRVETNGGKRSPIDQSSQIGYPCRYAKWGLGYRLGMTRISIEVEEI